MLIKTLQCVVVGLTVVYAYNISNDVVNAAGGIISNWINRMIKKLMKRKYDIICTLGSGKTSIIYKAKRRKDGMVVALKVLNRFNIYALESSAFETEQTILSWIHHPYIVRLLGSDSTLLSRQLELELATDGSLYSYVRRHGCLSELQVLRMICQMLNAIIYLYNKQLLYHRDIKPENILLFKSTYSYDGIVEHFYKAVESSIKIVFKLCDFGFSGNNGDKCGTKYYTHPRVFEEGHCHSLATELWSLSIVAHFALFGKNPYYERLQSQNDSQFLPDICMKKTNWKQLKIKLKKFFSTCLRLKADLNINDVIRLYNVLREDILNDTVDCLIIDENGTPLEKERICSDKQLFLPNAVYGSIGGMVSPSSLWNKQYNPITSTLSGYRYLMSAVFPFSIV